MGENPELFTELLLQISIAEGEKYDEAYRSWQEGLDLSFGEYERVLEPVPETTRVSPKAALPPADEPADSRIIGEDARRRVLYEKISTERPDSDSDSEQRRFEDYEFANFLRST